MPNCAFVVHTDIWQQIDARKLLGNFAVDVFNKFVPNCNEKLLNTGMTPQYYLGIETFLLEKM